MATSTPGHATHMMCLICKKGEEIGKQTKSYRFVRVSSKGPLSWKYDPTSVASILVCSSCTVEGEPPRPTDRIGLSKRLFTVAGIPAISPETQYTFQKLVDRGILDVSDRYDEVADLEIGAICALDDDDPIITRVR